MIANAFIWAIYGILWVLTQPLRLLPDVVLNEDFATAILNAKSYLLSIDTFIPLLAIIIVLGVIISVETAYWTYQGIMWVIRKIPSIN